MEKYVFHSKFDYKNIRINYNNTAYYSIFKSIYFYHIEENSSRLFDVYDLEILDFFVDSLIKYILIITTPDNIAFQYSLIDIENKNLIRNLYLEDEYHCYFDIHSKSILFLNEKKGFIYDIEDKLETKVKIFKPIHRIKNLKISQYDQLIFNYIIKRESLNVFCYRRINLNSYLEIICNKDNNFDVQLIDDNELIETREFKLEDLNKIVYFNNKIDIVDFDEFSEFTIDGKYQLYNNYFKIKLKFYNNPFSPERLIEIWNTQKDLKLIDDVNKKEIKINKFLLYHYSGLFKLLIDVFGYEINEININDIDLDELNLVMIDNFKGNKLSYPMLRKKLDIYI